MTVTGVQLHDVCGIDDLWNGEMDVFEAGDSEVLLLKHDDRFHAFQAICPHQDIPLVEGKFENGILTCRAHLWQFDAASGLGVNPTNTCLKRYPVEERDGRIWVGEQPAA